MIRNYSLSAVAMGFLAVLVSYSGPLAIFFQAGESANVAPEMMASWVWAVSMGAGISGILLSIWLKVPVVTAWSAPGAALLVGLFPDLSLNEAVGAYITAAAILFVIGVTGNFDSLIRKIPEGIAAGMMAGILFNFSLSAFQTIEGTPALALGMLSAYLLFRRMLPRYALILLLVTGVVLAVFLQNASLAGVHWSFAEPRLITPEWSLRASLAIPLLLVSLTGQFLPGIAIIRAAGYQVSARPIMGVTSLVSVPAALFGGITIVSAAITAAICTGKDAHEDPDCRYIAGIANGLFYLIGGLFAGTIVSLFTSLPGAFVKVLAGLALIGAISQSLASAMAKPRHREAAVISFVATASNMTLLSLSSAFWGVVIGYIAYSVLNDGE